MAVKSYLEIFTGGMYAGKTSALIAKGTRFSIAGEKVLYIKPSVDNRYSEDEIVTHTGESIPALSMITDGVFPTAMNSGASVILIDEVQFFQEDIVNHILMLVERGKTVYCSGLDLDYRGTPFEIVMQIMGYANKVNKLTAVCSSCGSDAFVTVRHSGSNYRLEVGGLDKYKPLCRDCFYNLKLRRGDK